MTAAPALRALCAAGVRTHGAVTGWQVSVGVMNASITARAYGSSDLGPPWVFGTAAEAGSMVWSGPGLATAGSTTSGGLPQITGAEGPGSPARSGRTDPWPSVNFARAPIAAVPEPGTASTLATVVRQRCTLTKPA